MSDEASFERFFAVTQALGGPERSAGRNASFRPTSGDDDVIAATSHDSFSGSFGQSGQISESFQDLSNNNPEKWTCRFQTTCAQLVFDRKRDWNKHMDRHDRPYRCEETGCKTIQGFTYPGGLVRHQREVHKTAGLSRVFCPIENCTRSSGLGFTRRENRDEHVRRLHLGKPADAVHSTVRYVDSKKHATSSKADTNIGTGMPEAPMASSVSGIQSSHLQRASKSPGPTTSTKEPRGKDVKDTVKQLEANLDSLMQRNGLISRDYQGLADRLNRLEMKLGKHIVP